MIRSCLLTRKEILEMLKSAPRTPDGYYFFPRFKVLIQLPGKETDSGYFYDRCLFKDKMVLDETDLLLFTAPTKLDFDYELKRIIDDKLLEVLKGYENLNLNDTIPGTTYTLAELIDTAVFIVRFKYS